VAHLLLDGVVRETALADPHAALAARDAVLIELRELVGAVADVPRFAEVRPLSVHDALHRPAQALHQALSELPHAVSFGEIEFPAADDKTLPGYEQVWQRAAAPASGWRATSMPSAGYRTSTPGRCCATCPTSPRRCPPSTTT
jgi:hypothetical protein